MLAQTRSQVFCTSSKSLHWIGARSVTAIQKYLAVEMEQNIRTRTGT